MTALPELLTLDELCERLKCSTATGRRMGLPVKIYVGASARYDWDDVVAFLAARGPEATKAPPPKPKLAPAALERVGLRIAARK